MGIPPMTTATCQLITSSSVMAILVLLFSDVKLYAAASFNTWAALLTLAALSTSIAYLIFFRIIQRAGASFVILVTMLVPLSAILLGFLVLGETLSVHEVIGAAIILGALVIIDGRALKKLGISLG